MELVASAVVGDLVNRFTSFLFNKYKSEAQSENKMKRLQDLVVRAHVIVEEAEMRYITNSKMLLQLKKLVEVMYQGYLVLDTHRYRTPIEVSSSFTTCIKQLFTCANDHELQPTLDCLESVLSNMKEFVFLLEGCERMFRTPYDSYLYIDNFMFGRHVEKQQMINILLQDNPPPFFNPTVLPVIGGVRVGKKTLVAHVCSNEKFRSQFPSVLHLNGENIWTMEHDAAPVMPAGKSLLVVHFESDVDDEVWLKFYSSAAKQMGKGSKILIVSKIRMLSRFGTVQPIYLNMSHQECSYLFKVLAFGSTNPEEHPRLASVAKDLAEALRGSLVTVNLFAHMLRKNQHVAAWLCILQKYRNVVENNISIFGVHPKNRMDKEHPIYITSLAPLAIRMRPMPPHREIDASKGRLPKVMLGDLIVGSSEAVLPKEEEFQVVVWEPRIPPYKRFVLLATYCDEPAASSRYHKASSPSRKRRRLEKTS